MHFPGWPITSLNASPFGFHAGILKQGILYKNKGLSKGGEEMQRISFKKQTLQVDATTRFKVSDRFAAAGPSSVMEVVALMGAVK